MATNRDALYAKDASGNVTGIMGPDGKVRGTNGFVPPTNDYAGIMSAYNAAVAAGGGTVQFLPVTYNIGGNTIPLANGIHYRGANWIPNFPNNIVDDAFVTTLSGTIIQGNGTASAFFGSGLNNQAQTMLKNCGVHDLSITNCTYGIQTGGLNVQGVSYSVFENILCTGCPLWGMWFENSIHCRFDHLYAFGCGANASSAVVAGGIRFVTSVSGMANNEIGEVVATAPVNLLAHVTEIYNRNNASGGITQANIVQGNRFNNPTFTPQAATTTASSPNIVVADGTKFAPDLPIVFTSTGTSGLTQNQTYFVQSVVGNTITVGNSNESPDLINFSSGQGSAVTINHQGFPCISIYRATATNGPVLNSVGMVDAEAGGTCKVLISGATVSFAVLAGVGYDTSSTSDICVRSGTLNGVWQFSAKTRFDLDASSAQYCSFAGYKDAAQYGSANSAIFLGRDANQSSNKVFNITSNFGASGSSNTFNNRSPGNADWTYPGAPLGVRQFWQSNYNGVTGTTGVNAGLNLGDVRTGFGVYTGAGTATWTWGQGLNSNMQGYRQTFKNQGSGALTITLGGSDGTFDGLTGGTSLGKSMLLAAPTAIALGGALTIVCCQVGAGTYQWEVESVVNATLV